MLFRQGDPPTRVYVLVEGAGKLVRSAPKGHQVVLALLQPGDVFGFVDLFGRADQTYTAEIVDEGWIVSWPQEVMKQIVERHPIIITNALRMMANRVEAYWLRIEDLTTVPVEQRVARAVLRLTSGTDRQLSIVHQDLAQFVGTTPPTLSRILHRWKTRGLVEVGRAAIRVRKLGALRAIAADP